MTVRPLLELGGSVRLRQPPDSVTTSRSSPSGWSSNFSSSDRVGLTPSVICEEEPRVRNQTGPGARSQPLRHSPRPTWRSS